jgi:transposase-like protein
MTGPDALPATALSMQVDVPQTTLSKRLRKAGIEPPFGIPNNSHNSGQPRPFMTNKRPNDKSPEEKLRAVLESASVPSDQLGEFLRKKGLHETHLQQWRLQMLQGLGKQPNTAKSKPSAAEAKQIRELEKELRRKDKALAETAALLVLKKKVQQIWGDEDDDTVGRNGK